MCWVPARDIFKSQNELGLATLPLETLDPRVLERGHPSVSVTSTVKAAAH